MLRFNEDADQLIEGERVGTEKKSSNLAGLLYDSNDKNSVFMQRNPDSSDLKFLSAEHIFSSGFGPSNNKFQSNIKPMKLNFDDEKTENQARNMEGSFRQSGMSNQYSDNILMAKIPSLNDLQTSNMFTNHFQGDDAEYYAYQNIDTEQHQLIQTI